MGAGASAEDRRELQRCFAAFQEAPGAGDGLSDDDFEALMREHAPLLYCKAEESGDAPAAARALRVQFATAREKLAARDAPPVPGAKDRLAQRAAARLKAAHPAWASDAPTNLQKGLVHGMLRSHALRTVTFSLGGETVAALLDTGAERSGMSIDAADRCGLRALIDGSFSRTVRGVGTAQGLGRVQYAEISFNGVPFHAAFDVMRWPESAVDFEAILGLDLLVRARAMIDVSGSQVDLTNHAGEATTVRLEYPEESDAFEKVKADIAGKRASKAADASAAAASQAKEANASRTDKVSVAEAFAANAARMAELGTDPAAMSNRQIKAELKSRGVDASSAIERSDLLALIRDARARANLAPTITPPAA